MISEKAFDEALSKLTPQQRLAVETVEGPVAVLAGPGTGKTHVLTLRMANILRVTQARPDSILALTFTDSSARTMRRRLAALIGTPAARKITITTFHGFAELVRSEYPYAFSNETDRQLMGSVEKTLLLQEALDTTSDINAIRPVRSPYHYLRDIDALYEILAREGIDIDAYRSWGQQARRDTAADPALQYKKGAHIGELTKMGLERVSRFDRVDEAARVLERYAELKEKYGIMDFSDMLIGVVNRIAENESLRSDLQERYQYILADEHQDANAGQHLLLSLLAYDDHPNIFIVGDEKQAIYRFQGAEGGSFENFVTQFPRTTVIELTTSFRSYQHILDAAQKIIGAPEKHTPLDATRSSKKISVLQFVADDPLSERSGVAALIETLMKSGVAPHDIAIIARTNKMADLFSQTLSAHGLPVLRAGDLSFTDRPMLYALWKLMCYVADPTELSSLRAALLAPWWNLDMTSLLYFLRTTSDKEFIRTLKERFPEVHDVLARCVHSAYTQTPSTSFSFLFEESGARNFFLSHAEHLDDIKLVRALMMRLESATALTKAATFAEAFSALERAFVQGHPPVQTSITERDGFVTVITAHKAKGMEFQYVFIPDCTEKGWGKTDRSHAIPSPFEHRQTLEDERHLFYVALTRAKDNVYLSYARASAQGRDQYPTIFMPDDVEVVSTDIDMLPRMHTVVDAQARVQELVQDYLETEGLSPSAINTYLKSPADFFARYVLRVREPATSALVYGSAIHAALAEALLGATQKEVYAALEHVFVRAPLWRDALFEKLRSEARCSLDAVLPCLSELGKPVHIEKNFAMEYMVDGVPVTLAGKIDATFIKDGSTYVADFKTGRSISSARKAYERQLALYAVLLSTSSEPVQNGELLGISESGIKHTKVPIGIKEQKEALLDVDAMVRELRSGAWRIGESSEYDILLTLLDNESSS